MSEVALSHECAGFFGLLLHADDVRSCFRRCACGGGACVAQSKNQDVALGRFCDIGFVDRGRCGAP